MPKGKNLLSTQFDKNQTQKEKPKDLFSRSELDEIKKTKSKKPQTQSVRISIDNVNKLKALDQILELNTMDEAITESISSREQELIDSQKAEYKTLLRIYGKKKHK